MALNQSEKQENIENLGLCSQMICSEAERIYIFGYGSLIWRPTIEYSRSWSGYIKGYKRRFYQGTTTHRGTPQQVSGLFVDNPTPGRVLTLLPTKNKEARVWGKVYEVDGAEQIHDAIEHLAEREMILGGYRFEEVLFYPRRIIYRGVNGQSVDEDMLPGTIKAVAYIAEPGNDQYLGKAPLDAQARQIAAAAGQCGPNVEYLRKLVEFLIKEVPTEDRSNDQYTLDLWHLVKEYLRKTKLCQVSRASIKSNDVASTSSASSS